MRYMRVANILRHKHEFTYKRYNLKQHESIIELAVLIIFSVVSVFPGNALAFELQLASLQAPQFAAPAQSQVFAYQSNVAVSYPSPITKKGIRKPALKPRVEPSISRSRALLVRPTSEQPLVMQGEASFYSRDGCLGCNPLRIMANGQPLNDNALTMAIGADKKHLVGRNARVTNLTTGQSVMVLITDTGGFYAAKYGHRVADLTIASKQAIGMRGGVGRVRVEVY